MKPILQTFTKERLLLPLLWLGILLGLHNPLQAQTCPSGWTSTTGTLYPVSATGTVASGNVGTINNLLFGGADGLSVRTDAGIFVNFGQSLAASGTIDIVASGNAGNNGNFNVSFSNDGVNYSTPILKTVPATTTFATYTVTAPSAFQYVKLVSASGSYAYFDAISYNGSFCNAPTVNYASCTTGQSQIWRTIVPSATVGASNPDNVMNGPDASISLLNTSQIFVVSKFDKVLAAGDTIQISGDKSTSNASGSFQVLTSMDGTNFALMATPAFTNVTPAFQTIKIAATQAFKYIKIVPVTGSSIIVDAVSVFGKDCITSSSSPTCNLSYSKIAASSLSGKVATGFDINSVLGKDGVFATLTNGQASVVVVDYGQTILPDADVFIYARSSYDISAGSFDVYTSTDGVNFNQVGTTVPIAASNTTFMSYQLHISGQFRYLKIAPNTTNTTRVDIDDISAYGITCAPPDADSDGVDDATDLDDDNDGILDSVESPFCPSGTGTGLLANKLYWLNWTNVGVSTSLTNNQILTWNLPDGSILKATVSNLRSQATGTIGSNTTTNVSSLSVQTVNTGTYNNFSTYYSPVEGLRLGTIGNQSAIDLTFVRTDANGTVIPAGIYAMDGEATRVNEGLRFNILDAGTWSGIEDITLGTNYTYAGVGTAQVTITSSLPLNTTSYGRKIMSAGNANKFSFTAYSDYGSLEGIALAVTCGSQDTDNDGIANELDLDSDGDGCSDAIEGGSSFTTANLVTSTMAGGNSGTGYTGTSTSPVTQNLGNTVGNTTTTMGVPTIAGTGQTVGTSQDKATQDANCTVTGAVSVVQATCGTVGGANADAKLILTSYTGGATKVGYSTGSSYTGPAFAAATALTAAPMNVVTNLANPVSDQPYTIRLFRDAAVYQDYVVVLKPQVCLTSDLSLTVGPATASGAKGEQVSYTFTLTNAGPDAAQGVTACIPIPANTTFLSATTSQGTYSSGTTIWDLGTVAVGSQTITVTLQVK